MARTEPQGRAQAKIPDIERAAMAILAIHTVDVVELREWLDQIQRDFDFSSLLSESIATTILGGPPRPACDPPSDPWALRLNRRQSEAVLLGNAITAFRRAGRGTKRVDPNQRGADGPVSPGVDLADAIVRFHEAVANAYAAVILHHDCRAAIARGKHKVQ